jgi:hypothetical protein
MKNHFKTMLLGTIVLSILSLNLTAKRNYLKTSIVVSEGTNNYDVSAIYDEKKTEKLIQYIDDNLKPDLIFKYKAQIDEKVTLKDKTTFYFNFLPGNMKIKLVKSENSNTSLIKIKKMCAGLNSVLNR